MQRFVREKGDTEHAVEKSTKYRVEIDNDHSAREIYEDVLRMPSTSASATASTPGHLRKRPIKRKSQRNTMKFDENKLFKAATVNDVTTIEHMHLNHRSVNVTDQFGWSALMMAACEGHLDAIKVLIRHGANIKMQNKQNETALNLAESKKHQQIVNYLKTKLELQTANESETICISSDEDDDDETTNDSRLKAFFCDICQTEFAHSDHSTHAASTLHRFNRKDSQKVSRHFGIPETNVGFKMLVQQGWDRESGLGANSNGVVYPVKTSLRKPRSGLGTRQPNKPRVTHFQAFDSNAVKFAKPPPSVQIVKTKRQLRAQKLRTQRKDRRLRTLLS